MSLPPWALSYLGKHPRLHFRLLSAYSRLRQAYLALARARREALAGRDELKRQRLARIKEAFAASSEASLDMFLGSAGVLHLRTSAPPLVSVLLVTFNRAELTFACLRSLNDACEEPFEVILVDNHSTDRTRTLLDRTRGARVIHNDDNLHFVKGANQAAAQARGEFLLFLNNDAQVLPAAIDSALRTIRSAEQIAAVGGKIVRLDGTLQEAGSIVWNDGSCLGYGRGEKPLDPEYMFRRDVDYCSGAFLLTRKAAFEAVGGFDLDYAPAYYEDADYCLKLWERGLRVAYDPGAVVLHFEFGSAPSAEAAITLQAQHQEVFAGKRRLEERESPDPSRVLFARDRPHKGLRVLFLEDQVPHPWLGSGLPRTNQLLKCLVALGHFVTFYPVLVPFANWEEIYRAVPPDVEVIRGMGTGGLAAFLRSRSGYYDVVLVSRPHNMGILEQSLRQEQPLPARIRVIYDAEALFCLRDIAGRQLRGETVQPPEIEALLAAEVALAKRAHAVISVSAGEAALFAERGVPEVHVLSQSLTPTPGPSAFPAREGFLFVGTVRDDGSPNADSLVWFIEEVWPLVRTALGSVHFLVVGVDDSSSVLRLAKDGVQFLGRPKDILPLYDAARVFVAPTRFGAGIPLKIQEAAAHGVPVVTTTVMGRQLGWENGVHLLMAHSAPAFAAGCADLYRSPELWERLRRNALERVAEDCSPARFALELDRILRSRTGDPRSPPGRAG
jgi:GT2 family glycosyltransferase/glycosyltransferase involved in cell wall biosynthesis